MSSTLWTIIETGDARSPVFPCRIIEPDRPNSLVVTGVDSSGLLRKGPPGAYRLRWRTEADPEDPNPQRFAAIPLGRRLTITFSHGNSNFLSLSLAGVDITCEFDISTRVLSTSWFSPAFTVSWTLEMPRKIMTRLLEGVKPLLLSDSPTHEDSVVPETSFVRRLYASLCCTSNADSSED